MHLRGGWDAVGGVWGGERVRRGDPGPGGRCHDDDMGLDRWGAANDE